METIAFVFGIFGLIAFEQVFSLKKRLDRLEERLTKVKGTPFHQERQDLVKAAGDFIGQSVILEQKEDYMDSDIVSYGNTKHGSNTILDVDAEWLLVRIDGPKGSKEKLIRTESIEKITRK